MSSGSNISEDHVIYLKKLKEKNKGKRLYRNLNTNK